MDNQIKQERGSEELSAAIVENGYSELDCNPHIYWTKLFECQTLSKEEINKIAETTAKEKSWRCRTMDKEKQIEEMAKVIDEQTDRCQADTYCEKCSFENNIKNVGCCSASAANALYNAGYRKTFASSLATNEQVAYKEGYNKGIAEMTQAVENANDELERQWLTSISLEAHNHEINELKAENKKLKTEITAWQVWKNQALNEKNKEIEELKAENERIRQNSVTHETFKAIMDEKDKEIAVLNKALELFFEYADHFIQSKQAYKDGYRSSQGYWKDKARKELEEV